MQNYDAIVIGGGLGGLVAGAKLAKEGKQVLLLEQHNVPGGCATTFKRNEFTMEVGLHEMDGLYDETDPKQRIFKDLGVFENVEFLKLPEFYRFKNHRVDVVVPDDAEQAIELLTNQFPEEAKGIKKFFRKIFAIRKEANRTVPLWCRRWKFDILMPIFPAIFPHLAFNSYATLGKYLDSIIDNEDLKLILAANVGYYHDDPYSMSLIYFSVAQGGYYKGGTYIKGGSQKLSDYLAKVIKDNGGEILLRHLVTGIIVENNKAVGVNYKENRKNAIHIMNAHAKVIIANAAIPNVVDMLPEKNKQAKKVKNLQKACSLITIYFGFNKEPKALGNKHYSTFVFDDSINTLQDMPANFRGNFADRNYVFVDYSQIESELAPAGKSVGVICTIDYLSDWENLSSEEYKAKKSQVAQIYREKLEKLIPGIDKEIGWCEVATPKTIKRYTLNPHGTVYGYAQIPKQAGPFRTRIKSPVKGLYFASAWTNPGGGFTAAIMSGWFCANEALGSINI
ncbi:MAG: NAD(P)/FAD-dependent oxidoreductase [Gammaproteobacteria bacterium]|nr:MAG: NAD(P)/FAD-dependent oxidoreductase [Gammaproteobacteria bacterium]